MIDIKKFQKDFKSKISLDELKEIDNFFNENENFRAILGEKKELYSRYKYLLYFLIFVFIFINIVLAINLIFALNILFNIVMFFIIFLLYSKFELRENTWFVSRIKSLIKWENGSTKEEEIFSEFISKMFKWAKFSLNDKYFDESVDQVKNKTWLLSSYDRVRKFSNSLEYEYEINEKTKAKISWIEIYTQRKRKGKNWKRKRVKADHVYVQKINIKWSENKVFDWIKITHKMSRAEIISTIIILTFLWFFLYNLVVSTTDMRVILISWSILTVFVLLIFKDKIRNLLWFSKWKNINLEDINLSKKYNIRAQDQQSAREILDSRTIRSINNLTEMFPRKKFNFLFEWNEIYIVIHLNKDFFTLWNYIFLNSSLKWYVEFYILSREIFNIPKYLYIDYHVN